MIHAAKASANAQIARPSFLRYSLCDTGEVVHISVVMTALFLYLIGIKWSSIGVYLGMYCVYIGIKIFDAQIVTYATCNGKLLIIKDYTKHNKMFVFTSPFRCADVTAVNFDDISYSKIYKCMFCGGIMRATIVAKRSTTMRIELTIDDRIGNDKKLIEFLTICGCDYNKKEACHDIIEARDVIYKLCDIGGLPDLVAYLGRD